MSRRLLAFLLSEIKTVRVACPRCAAVTELTVEQMGYRLDDLRCPVCRAEWTEFIGGELENNLKRLGKAIADFQKVPGAKHIEFILPDPSSD